MQCEMPRALVEPTRRASSAEPPAMVAASMISMSRWRESSLSCSSRSNMTIYANGTNHWFEGSTAERRGPFRGLCRAQNAPEGAARLARSRLVSWPTLRNVHNRPATFRPSSAEQSGTLRSS